MKKRLEKTGDTDIGISLGSKILGSKILGFIKGQFLLGILLGAISSVLVNSFSVEYGKYIDKVAVNDSLYSELKMNKTLITNQQEQGLIYLRDFYTNAWDMSKTSGYLYKLSPGTMNQLTLTYYEINRANKVRSIFDEYSYNLIFESTKMAGLSVFYNEQGYKDNNSNYLDISQNTAVEGVATMNAGTYINNSLLDFTDNTNKNITGLIDTSTEMIKNEKITNPMNVLTCSLAVFSGFVIIFVGFVKRNLIFNFIKYIFKSIFKLVDEVMYDIGNLVGGTIKKLTK